MKYKTKSTLFFCYPSRNIYVGEGEPNLEEVEKFVQENSKDEKVQQFLEKIRPINDDAVKNYVENNEAGKKLLNTLTDKKVNQAVKNHDVKFKEEKLPGLIATEVEKVKKELKVEETPEQKEMNKIKDDLAKLQKKSEIAEIKTKALEIMNEVNLPFGSLVDNFIDETLEKTVEKIQNFKDVWDKALKKQVEKKLGENNGREVDDHDKKPESLEKQLETAKKAGNLQKVMEIKNKIHEEGLKEAEKKSQ